MVFAFITWFIPAFMKGSLFNIIDTQVKSFYLNSASWGILWVVLIKLENEEGIWPLLKYSLENEVNPVSRNRDDVLEEEWDLYSPEKQHLCWVPHFTLKSTSLMGLISHRLGFICMK